MKTLLGKNFFGAYADAAVLFPLLAALTIRSEFSAPMLLASAGLAYWAAGLLFRTPMSVQPLKSIAIAAIATGATAMEVRISGALLGFVCLGLILFDVNRVAQKVPSSLIHCLQLALGLLLIRQGMDSAMAGAHPASLLWIIALVAALVLIPKLSGIPLLGAAATGGLLWAIFHPENPPSASAAQLVASSQVSGLRLAMIAALTLPQIALTLGNSVLGTYDVAKRAFGDQAKRVTIRRLLGSIGMGNLISASLGGLPFCHGSGGLTAHIRGGASHWTANAIIGTTLLILAAFSASGGHVQLLFPPLLLGSLLAATGIFHLELAKPTWATSLGKVKLLVAGAMILATRNMLWVTAAAVAFEVLEVTLLHTRKKEMAA